MLEWNKIRYGTCKGIVEGLMLGLIIPGQKRNLRRCMAISVNHQFSLCSFAMGWKAYR